MFSSQTIAALGANRQQIRINHIIANNLSNTQTTGYKKDIPLFESLLQESAERSANPPSETSMTVLTQGFIHKTGNIRYTRAGDFRLNKEQKLVTANGYPVQGRNGDLTLNGKNISIGGDGTVEVDGNPSGQIQIVTFADPSGLRKEGYNLFQFDGDPVENKVDGTLIHQEHLETSNVNPIEEMINLMDSHRNFEACLKIIQSNDALDSKATNELGRL
ncbi:MAG: flagellar hook-basal body protein [Deltaproteobacteria bacterium]|nr:flagellar hook-basal body protein [Deltaproteobacteria bacterium]